MIYKVGDIFEQSFTVNDEIYNKFIIISQDKNPLHTDEQFAFSKGFNEKVMHGNILNVFISYFIGECLPTKNVLIHSQEIQFKKAVYLNDTLNFAASIVGVYDSVNAVEFKFYFKNKELKTVAKGKIQIGLLK